MFTSFVLLVLACSSEEPRPVVPPPSERKALCNQFEPYEGLRNHLQPFTIAVDVSGRRAYSASLWNASLGVFDLDSAAPLAMLPTGHDAPTDPAVAVGGGGAVWLLSSSSPALVRFDGEPAGRLLLDAPMSHADSAVAHPDGGLVVLGAGPGGEQVLQRFDASGAATVSVTLEQRGRQLFAMHDGGLGLLAQGGGEEGLSLRDPNTLAETGRCALPFEANYGAALADGTVVVAEGTRIGLAGCDGREARGWFQGAENREVVSMGDAAVVLDRTGTGAWDPHQGVAWVVDAQGVHEDRSFATGKHTGHGAWDPVAGRLWVNAKGSSEVLVLDPEQGVVVSRIRTGTYLDGIALDPQLDDVIYGVGRLSNTVVRIEDSEATAWNEDLFWPFTPVVDVKRDLLWVLSQGRSVVHGLDRTTLTVQRSLDPGLAPDRYLTFGSIVLHPERRSLFMAHGELDLLLELDPDSGVELARWELGGPLIQERKNIGQLWLQVCPDTGALLVARSNDARVQRVHPDRGLEATAWLGDEVAAELAVSTSMEFATLVSSELLYVGGHAVDAVSLEALPERTLTASLVLGPHPDEGAGLLGIGPDARSFLLFDPRGHPVMRKGFATETYPSLRYDVDETRNELVLVRAREGRICWFPMADMEPLQEP
jgi:hypothetical protein